MQRKTAVAAAAAISMSLASAVIAIGANVGALGFAPAPSATVAQAPATVVVSSQQSAAPNLTSSRTGEHERDGQPTPAGASTSGTTREGQQSHD